MSSRPASLPPAGQTPQSRGRKLTKEELSDLMRSISREFCRSDEYRAHMRRVQQAKWNDPEYRVRQRAAIQAGRARAMAARKAGRKKGEKYF